MEKPPFLGIQISDFVMRLYLGIQSRGVGSGCSGSLKYGRKED
jgi:hypothetical protein